MSAGCAPFLHYIFRFFLSGLLVYSEPNATGFAVTGSNPGGGMIFRVRPDRSRGQTSLLYNGY